MQKLTEAECAQIRKMNEAAAKKNLKEAQMLKAGDKVTTTEDTPMFYSGYAGRPVATFMAGMVGVVVDPKRPNVFVRAGKLDYSVLVDIEQPAQGKKIDYNRVALDPKTVRKVSDDAVVSVAKPMLHAFGVQPINKETNEAAAKKNLCENDTGSLKMGGGDVGSLSYVGKLPGSYNDLVSVFGEPQTRYEEGGKTTVQWNGRVGQRPFVIYDYKSDKKAEDNTDWHIGGIPNRGATNDVADAVVAYFNEKKAEPVKESTDDDVTNEIGQGWIVKHNGADFRVKARRGNQLDLEGYDGKTVTIPFPEKNPPSRVSTTGGRFSGSEFKEGQTVKLSGGSATSRKNTTGTVVGFSKDLGTYAVRFADGVTGSVNPKDNVSLVNESIKESSIPVVDEIMRNMSDDHNLGIIRDALQAYGYAGNVVNDAIMRDPFSAENTEIIRSALEGFLVEDEPVAESKVWALAQTSLRESEIMRFV